MRTGHRPITLLGVLLLAAVLGGCTAPPAALDEVPDGLTRVEIWINRPLMVETTPLRELTAYPYRVAFTPADNATRALVGAGIWAYAEGWPEGYNLTANDDRPPAQIRRDWMQDSGMWFRGDIPAGNYSTIRVEMLEVEGVMERGIVANITIMFGRLSFEASGDGVFSFPAGETQKEVFAVMIERTGRDTFLIK